MGDLQKLQHEQQIRGCRCSRFVSISEQTESLELAQILLRV